MPAVGDRRALTPPRLAGRYLGREPARPTSPTQAPMNFVHRHQE